MWQATEAVAACSRQGSIEVIINTGALNQGQGQRGQSKSAAAAAATFSMADRIRRILVSKFLMPSRRGLKREQLQEAGLPHEAAHPCGGSEFEEGEVQPQLLCAHQGLVMAKKVGVFCQFGPRSGRILEKRRPS